MVTNYFDLLKSAKVPAALWPQQPRSEQLQSLEAEAARFTPERLGQLYQCVPTADDVANLKFFTATTAALAACLAGEPAPTPEECQRQLSEAFWGAEKQARFSGDPDDRDAFKRAALFCALLTQWDSASISRANPDASQEDMMLFLRAERLLAGGNGNGS